MNTIAMVDCGVCGRVHEDLPSVDCRAFRQCPKCGDGYRSGEYGPIPNALTEHIAVCDGAPSANITEDE